MCSFIFTTKTINSSDIARVNKYTIFRGPDDTTITRYDKFTMIHNLLDISGELRTQPILDSDQILLFNGEIYNSQSKCDTDDIIPLFRKERSNMVNYLDGEYAIVIFDLPSNSIFIYTDIFATKPLYYCVQDDDIGISTYEAPLIELGFNDIKRVSYSTELQINLNTNQIYTRKHSPFDLREYKNSYDSCFQALEESVAKRCTKKCALGLSEGYDSGCILQASINTHCSELHSYYIRTTPSSDEIMLKRSNICQSYKVIDYTTYPNIQNKIEASKLFPLVENIRHNNGESLYTDSSTLLLSKMFREIREDGINIFISGQGGDEITCNYQKYRPFFTDLAAQFPWENFYNGKNYQYISYTERIGGVYGIEVRYPLLDKKFVQNFLNLKRELKNKAYKSVLYEYMMLNNTPMIANRKRGLHVPRELER